MSQRVLVTGAASGIGLEIARAFSAAGAGVYITDVGEQALAAAREEIPGLRTAVCDNSTLVDIGAMVPAALCVFLASDAERSISVQVIPIDNDAHQASLSRA